eukprot:2604749-Prymnesium_polylepis.1
MHGGPTTSLLEVEDRTDALCKTTRVVNPAFRLPMRVSGQRRRRLGTVLGLVAGRPRHSPRHMNICNTHRTSHGAIDRDAFESAKLRLGGRLLAAELCQAAGERSLALRCSSLLRFESCRRGLERSGKQTHLGGVGNSASERRRRNHCRSRRSGQRRVRAGAAALWPWLRCGRRWHVSCKDRHERLLPVAGARCNAPLLQAGVRHVRHCELQQGERLGRVDGRHDFRGADAHQEGAIDLLSVRAPAILGDQLAERLARALSLA